MHRSLLTATLATVPPTNNFYATVGVPFELQEILHKVRIYKSLATTDREEALAILPNATHEIRSALIDLFKTLLAEVDTTGSLDPEAEICRDIVLTPQTKPYSRRVVAALDRVGFIGAGNRLRTTDEEAIKVCRLADRLIDQSHVVLRRFSKDYWRFCQGIRRIQRDAYFAIEENSAENPIRSGRLDNDNRREQLENALLEDVIQRYRGEVSHKWTSHVRQMYGRQFEIMAELLGAKTPIRNLTRGDFKDLRDVMDAVPPNYELVAALKGLPLRIIAEKAKQLGLPGRSFSTVGRLITTCRSVMGYAENEGSIEKNCVVGLFRRPPSHMVKPVQPFSPVQLLRFFHVEPVYQIGKANGIRDGRFWIPLIALFSGMRLREITQLEIYDIVIENDVPIFKIAGDSEIDGTGAKTLKTMESRRVVPIHPELQRIGLLDYHQQALAAGLLPLFPELRRNEYTKQYDQFKQQVTHDMARSKARSQNHSFRSFRHNFRDGMREARTSDEIVRRLGGWTLASIADEYGAGPSLGRLYEEVCKVSYPGLDLSHLYVPGARTIPCRLFEG